MTTPLSFFLLVLLSTTPAPGLAQELNPADTAWILTSAVLVLFMTLPGLALFYGGLVRSRNVLTILGGCFAITSLVSLLWGVAGYSLALTEGGSHQPFLGGTSRLFLAGMQPETLYGNLPESVFSMYHLTFAIFSPALIIGGLAERVKFSSLLLFAVTWELLVYVPVCHWIWGGGWLAERGVMDFAGGVVVHANASIAALVGALMIGPRKGFPTTPLLPHNLTLTAIGAGILWVGWHGFSAGSALMASGAAGIAMLNTHLAAAAGASAWMLTEWIRFGKPTTLGIMTGMVAGLGVIAAGAGFVSPMGALIIGLLAGLSCFIAIHTVKRLLKVDDALDVFAIHGVSGILGALLTGIFASEALGGSGTLVDEPARQLGIQAQGILATLAWSGGVSYLLFKLIDQVTGLRVSTDEEAEGLDLALHDEKGYDL